MSNKIYELSTSEFESLIKSSHNINEVLFKLNLTTVGNSWAYSLVKKRMSELGLSGENFIGRSAVIQQSKSQAKTNEEMFVENSSYPRCALRRRILRDRLIDYKCANPNCGISQWNGKDLSLELDHINGINNDNRLQNLRFLCPNCHSQTSTYGSKNLNNEFKKTTNAISDAEISLILEKYKELNNIKKVKDALKIKESVISSVIRNSEISKKSNQKYVIRYDLFGTEIARYGSINEACNALIKNQELSTSSIKTARNNFLRNYHKVWLNSNWKLIDQ